MNARDLRLERLDRAVHEARFLEFAAEFRDAGEDGLDRIDLLFADPDEYYDLADRFEHDRDLPDPLVAMSRFLLFDGDRLVGQSNLRRRLSPALHLDGGHIGYAVRPSARCCGFAARVLLPPALRVLFRVAHALGVVYELPLASLGGPRLRRGL